MTAMIDRQPHPSTTPHRPGWLRRRKVPRLELASVALFHLAVALLITFAPRSQVITPGTSEIFGTVSPPIWAVWFLATGLVAAAAVYRVARGLLWTVWAGVFPLGAAWIYGFSQAVTDGRGNAIFAIVWPFLLVWWLLLAVRLHLGGTEAWWGGR